MVYVVYRIYTDLVFFSLFIVKARRWLAQINATVPSSSSPPSHCSSEGMMAARRGRSNCVIYETLFSTTIIPTTINKDLLVHDVSSEAEATRVCSSQARWRLVLFLTNMTMSIRPGQYPTENGQLRSFTCSSVELFDSFRQLDPWFTVADNLVNFGWSLRP